jgi:hypothetical protein
MKDLPADLDQWQQQHEEVAPYDDGCAGRIRSAGTGH